MSKTSTEIFNDKVNLIYEYNKKSPLFVRMANTEIENNNIDRAIEILAHGIKQFPDYAVARLLLAKAFTLSGNYTQAINEVKTGSELIHSSKTYEFYVKEIDVIKKQRSLFQTTKRSAFVNEENFIETSDPGLFEEPSEITNPALDQFKKTKSAIDDRLGEIANEISSAKIPPVAKEIKAPQYNYNNFAKENMIVSETLAKIYIAQGEYIEAIKVYEKLKLKTPKQIDYYNEKIKELKKEIE